MSNEEFLEQYRNYVKKVLDTTSSDELINEGKNLLAKDFENNVIDLCSDFFDETDYDYSAAIIEDVRNRDKLKFVTDVYYKGTRHKDLRDFIANNWEKLDVIIKILFLHYIANEEPTAKSEKKMTSKEALERIKLHQYVKCDVCDETMLKGCCCCNNELKNSEEFETIEKDLKKLEAIENK